jgi:hypothetical protein
VEEGIPSLGCVVVVELEGAHEAALGHAELRLQLFEAVARCDDRVVEDRGLVDLSVHDQPHPAVLVEERLLAQVAHVGVFLDAALAPCVDEHSPLEPPGLGHEQRDRRLVEVAGRGACSHAEANATAVVAVSRNAHLAVECARYVAGQHLVVEDESAGGQHDPAARAEAALLAEVLGHDAHDTSTGVDHEVPHAVIGLDACAASRRRGAQVLHQDRPPLAGYLADVTARRGAGDLAVGGAALRPGEDEPIVAGRLTAGAVAEGFPEGHALRLDPLEVLDAALAVESDLGLIGGVATGCHQVGEHVVRAVLEAAGVLERGSAAEVDHAAGDGGGSAPCRGPLEHHDLRTRGRGIDRGRSARGPQAHDEHVALAVEAVNLRVAANPRDHCLRPPVARMISARIGSLPIGVPGSGGRWGGAIPDAGMGRAAPCERGRRPPGGETAQQRPGTLLAFRIVWAKLVPSRSLPRRESHHEDPSDLDRRSLLGEARHVDLARSGEISRGVSAGPAHGGWRRLVVRG